MTTKGFSEAEVRKLPEVASELSQELGIEKVAGRLAMMQEALTDFILGKFPPKPPLAKGLARLKNVSLEELLADAAADAQQPATVVEPKTVPEAPPTEVKPPSTEPAVSKPAAVPPSPPPSPPATTVQPLPTAIEPTRRQTESRAPSLSLDEYAGLSKGLEMLPQKRDEVCAYYGLQSEDAREAEEAAWEKYFEENPRDRVLFKKKRELLVDFWRRFDQRGAPNTVQAEAPHISAPVIHTSAVAPPPPLPAPPPSVRSTLGTGQAPEPPPTAVHKFVPPTVRQDSGNETALDVGVFQWPTAPAAAPEPPPTPTLPTPPIPLAHYAAVSVDLQLFPERSEAIFQHYGLADPRRRSEVDAAWKVRFAAMPNERGEFERLCHERYAAHAPPPAPARTHAAPTAPTSGALPARPGSLAQYALMCVELEKKPHETESIYAQHGLVDPAKRRSFLDAWRARLAAIPEERAQWEAEVARIRDDWMDL